MHISPVLFSPDSAEADIGWGAKLNGDLMASCVRNVCNKNYQNWITLLQVMMGKFWCVH